MNSKPPLVSKDEVDVVSTRPLILKYKGSYYIRFRDSNETSYNKARFTQGSFECILPHSIVGKDSCTLNTFLPIKAIYLIYLVPMTEDNLTPEEIRRLRMLERLKEAMEKEKAEDVVEELKEEKEKDKEEDK